MVDRHRITHDAHDAHDLELVARAAAGDLAAGEAAAARDLVASCEACAALEADLRAIAAATRELAPAAALASTRSAPRDFRLTEVDAARLRRRRPFGLAWLAGRDPRRVRALGGALAALGVVGLLVSTGMPALLGAAGGAAVLSQAGAPASMEFMSGAQRDAATRGTAAVPAPTDPLSVTMTSDPGLNEPAAVDEPAWGERAPLVLAIGSVAVLAVGIALLLAARNGRRSGP